MFEMDIMRTKGRLKELVGQKRTQSAEINPLPKCGCTPFQYSMEAPSFDLSHTELNKVIRKDIVRFDTQRTWSSPTYSL